MNLFIPKFSSDSSFFSYILYKPRGVIFFIKISWKSLRQTVQKSITSNGKVRKRFPHISLFNMLTFILDVWRISC